MLYFGLPFVFGLITTERAPTPVEWVLCMIAAYVIFLWIENRLLELKDWLFPVRRRTERVR